MNIFKAIQGYSSLFKGIPGYWRIKFLANADAMPGTFNSGKSGCSRPPQHIRLAGEFGHNPWCFFTDFPCK